MGAHPSVGGGALPDDGFHAPLLPQETTASRDGHGWIPSSSSDQRIEARCSNATITSASSSHLLSFKASRVRKTKDFIASAKQTNDRQTTWDFPADVDPRLLEDADAHEVSAKVAEMIFHWWDQFAAATPCPQGPAEDEFHEAHFVRRRCCARCWPRRASASPVPSQDVVLRLIDDISTSLYFCKQVVVLAAVYIERLLHQTSVAITSNNWRSLVIVTLLIASKVWEDVHPWNADFQDCLQEVTGIQYQPGALYRLESLFLDRLRWDVFVDGEVYASYYFALVSGGRHSKDTWGISRRPVRAQTTDNFAIDTIIEDELYVNSDSDIERGDMFPHPPSLVPEHAHGASSAASASSATPPCSPNPNSKCPWSREELAATWRKRVLAENGDPGTCHGFVLRARRDSWKLDARNPLIGALRHAPRARAPSEHLPQSAELLWAHELASRSADLFGPHRQTSKESSEDSASANTISGATGSQLASELRDYLGRGSGPLPRTQSERPGVASVASIAGAF